MEINQALEAALRDKNAVIPPESTRCEDIRMLEAEIVRLEAEVACLRGTHLRAERDAELAKRKKEVLLKLELELRRLLASLRSRVLDLSGFIALYGHKDKEVLECVVKATEETKLAEELLAALDSETDTML